MSTDAPITQSAPPLLPSARPSKAVAIGAGLVSLLLALAGIGLAATAIATYDARAERRLAHSETLTALERAATIRQKQAQLQRNQSAPVWIVGVFDPTHRYEVKGSNAVSVPVIVGLERDTAICIGVLGPEGFTQDRDHPRCLGY